MLRGGQAFKPIATTCPHSVCGGRHTLIGITDIHIVTREAEAESHNAVLDQKPRNVFRVALR